jgi:hypothetical protein
MHDFAPRRGIAVSQLLRHIQMDFALGGNVMGCGYLNRRVAQRARCSEQAKLLIHRRTKLFAELVERLNGIPAPEAEPSQDFFKCRISAVC